MVSDADMMYIVHDCVFADEKPEVMEGENTIVRARNLSSKTRHRMYQKAIRDLQNMKLRTQEAINNLKHTIDLVNTFSLY